MRISVILSTYNAPEWLEKVLWGYAAQSCRPHEIVIADDGSTADTRRTIERLERSMGLAVVHAWHEDRGFRKCEIVNKALVAASGEYLIFSDGDCIPGRDFVATHRRLARPGSFLSGGLVRLPMDLSRRVTADDIASGRTHSLRWLLRHGLPINSKCLMVAGSRKLGALLDRVTTTQATWNGHNASAWKSDIVRVNGFDERMGWGGEDRELGERLVNAGLRGRQIRHRAICVHLDHPRGYVDQQVLRWNRRHRQIVRDEKLNWTDYGIKKSAEDADEGMILQFPTARAVRRQASCARGIVGPRSITGG